jgi:hypothetical protein
VVYTFICEKRVEIDGIKILLVGDAPDAHLVLRALKNYDDKHRFEAIRALRLRGTALQ